MSDPLSILRAQVEAAETALAETKPIRGAFVYSRKIEDGGQVAGFLLKDRVQAHGALRAVQRSLGCQEGLLAVFRRMVSDEGIEQAARAIGMRGIRQIVDHTGETIDETWDDFPDEHRAQCRDLALAALSSLLTGGV